MDSSIFYYKFPLKVLDFNDPYDRWLFSLAQFANDSQLFSHLWSIYRPLQFDGEPRDLWDRERMAIGYHAMAHTYEALRHYFSLKPDSIAPTVVREKVAVFSSKMAKEQVDLRAVEKRISKKWFGKTTRYHKRFRRIRNVLFAHYPNSDGKRNSTSYWGIIAQGQRHGRWDGTIIQASTGANQKPPRYRHVFIDRLQAQYVSEVFGEDITDADVWDANISGFLSDVGELFDGLLVPMLTRLIIRREANIREHHYDAKARRWRLQVGSE